MSDDQLFFFLQISLQLHNTNFAPCFGSCGSGSVECLSKFFFKDIVWLVNYRRRWLLSVGAYSFSQQENERLTANMRLIGIPLINMGGVIIILWNTAGEALNKYTIKPTAK